MINCPVIRAKMNEPSTQT